MDEGDLEMTFASSGCVTLDLDGIKRMLLWRCQKSAGFSGDLGEVRDWVRASHKVAVKEAEPTLVRGIGR